MHVTVCVCTRNRGASIVETVAALNASTYDDFDIVIVDQSIGDDTQEALRDVIYSDSRIQYLRSTCQGSSVGRNSALTHARGPIVAFTDDDCDVSPDWLERLVAYFRAYPDIAQICGPVLPVPHDPTAGFIPTCQVPQLRKITSPWMKWRERGIGANMAFRRDALEAVGRWDEVLGPGSPLFACTDGDLTYRILRAGFAVLNVPDATVSHRGFRAWQQACPMMRRVGTGVGAAYTKHLRLGDVAVLPTLLVEWVRCVSWGRLLRLRKRCGVARFLAYGAGMRRSFAFAIDPSTRTYIPRDAARPAAVDSHHGHMPIYATGELPAAIPAVPAIPASPFSE